jgi:hypothetical protein
MIRLWDFATCSCGKRHNDEPIDSPRVPKTIGCECGKRVGWVRHKRNHIHESVSTLYGRGVDPQFGCVVEDYGHKQQLLKEKGLVEVGIERVDDIMNDGAEDTGARNPAVGTLDAETDDGAVQELMDSLYQRPDVDRRHTGNPRPMLDSWGSFDPNERG